MYAARNGIPVVTFSGLDHARTPWYAPTPRHSRVFAELAYQVTAAFVESGKPYLPFNQFSEDQCDGATKFKIRLDAYFRASLHHDGYRGVQINDPTLEVVFQKDYGGNFWVINNDGDADGPGPNADASATEKGCGEAETASFLS